MDHLLDARVQARRRLRRVGLPLVVVVGLTTILLLLPGWMRGSLARTRIRTAIVTRGPIDAVITAAGIVEPEVEQVLSSPVDARILRVLKRPGEPVKAGEPLVALDTSATQLMLDRLAKDLRVKDTQQAQARLTLEQALVDFDRRIELKTLDVETAESRSTAGQQLFEKGLLSKDALAQAALAAKQAEIELAQLQQQRLNTRRATELALEQLTLERASVVDEERETKRVLDLASAASDRPGVVTWVVQQEGALVRRGDVIARLADLSSFKVNASVSDVHASRLTRGTPVLVKLNDLTLEGEIAEVPPAVEDGTMHFSVTLRERAHPALRPSLRIDVLVVTDRRADALRLPRGNFAEGTARRNMFVVRGNHAVRTSIELGVIGFEQVEVRAGIAEGDEVIVSDMTDYLHMTEVALK